MNIKKKKYDINWGPCEVEVRHTYLPSCDGKSKLHVMIWEPIGDIKAVLQISHGMVEYIGRYDEFARYLASYGIVVAGNDHLGHGLTATGERWYNPHTASENDDKLGYIGTRNGSEALVRDLHRVTVALKRAYPNSPIFLMGHSMGSFLVRRYICEYGNNPCIPSNICKAEDLAGVIIMGTGDQPGAAVKSGLAIDWAQRLIHGREYRSHLIKKISFAGYLNKVPTKVGVLDEEDQSKSYIRQRASEDWLTRDVDVVDSYMMDKYCTFVFTVDAYRALFETLEYINKKANIDMIVKETPVLFVSGDADPVGAHGKAPMKLSKMYKKKVSDDTSLILYKGARHEILNELERTKTYEDILWWITSRI